MGELDGDTGAQRLLAVRRRQVDEQRPETLAAGVDGVPADGRDDPRAMLDGSREPLLELVEVRSCFLQKRLGAQGLRLPSGDESPGAVATWRATLPPPSSLYRTSSKPALAKSAAKSSGPGKRRTLAGRYA